jgi:hypothetical protein
MRARTGTDGLLTLEQPGRETTGKREQCMWGMRGRYGVNSGRWRSVESGLRWGGGRKPCARKHKKGDKMDITRRKALPNSKKLNQRTGPRVVNTNNIKKMSGKRKGGDKNRVQREGHENTVRSTASALPGPATQAQVLSVP